MTRSPTVPTAEQTEADVLDARAEIWRKRPLLRAIYQRYFQHMIDQFARPSAPVSPTAYDHPRYGRVVELGGGSGNFREYFSPVIATDIVPTPHVHLALDAMHLPFPDNSIDNLLMQDVLHHLPYPLAFLAEAQRVLRPRGRLVMTEPYLSPFSRLVFKLTHPEPFDLRTRLYGSPASNTSTTLSHQDPPAFTGAGAFAANQAIPTLLFFRDLPLFAGRFPHLRLIQRTRFDFLVYPLSGGFSGPQLLPRSLAPAVWALERILSPLTPLLAFRLRIVLEKADI